VDCPPASEASAPSPTRRLVADPAHGPLARRAVPVHAAAGEAVVVQGESGDRFLAIADGDFEVTVDGGW
jgi:hypothetical protein